MKKILILILASFISISAYSQVSDKQINDLINTLKAGGYSEEAIKSTINGIINDPDLYNTLWKNFIDQAFKQDSARWKLLRDLNVQFKTFQATESSVGSLGLAYDLNFNYAKFQEHNQNRISHSFGLSAQGNVAFNKKLNPLDFLETRVSYSYSHFIGGVVTKSDEEVFSRLNDIEDKLVNEMDIQSQSAMALWEEFGKYQELSNQYYYAIAPKFALESNQDFSKMQFAPGLAIDLGAKAWNNKNALAYINIFDYPFALLRLITGTDKKFTLYGSTIPTAQLVFDYVMPASDTLRKSLAGNLDPFPRIKFETSFRTFITRIKKENIFFNADFRYYQELSASDAIVQAGLDHNIYFVMALQSSSGFYVSYANGKLPFDVKNDEVYSIGFNFKFD